MKHNLRFEVNRIRASIRSNVGIMLELEAPELVVDQAQRERNGVVFVVDRSGSMGNGRLELVKNTIAELMGRLSADDFLAIVSFDNEVAIDVPLTRVGDIDRAEVRRQLAQMRPGGSTNLELGYRQGLAEASNAPSGVPVRVVLLSDGHANRGNQDPGQLGQLAAAAREHLISTSTLGIGEQFDERLLTVMSEQGYGLHLAAIKVQEAVTGLEDDLKGLLSVTAREITAELTNRDFPGAVTFTVPGQAREVKRNGGTTTVFLGDLGSGEERSYLFNLVAQPAAASIAGTSVSGTVTIKLSWIDSATGESRNLELDNPVEVVVDESNWVEPARDEQVVVEMGFFRVQDVKLAAAEHVRAGRIAEAEQLLGEARANLVNYMAAPQNLSPRQARMLQDDLEELDYLTSEGGRDAEFIKRSYESALRKKMSKLDPRKKPKDNS